MNRAWRAVTQTIDAVCAEPFDPLATVFEVVLNWRAAAALLSPAPTHRTMASRPFGVRRAFGFDQMDNLLKAHS
jgi:hypothetical protein